jgi:hypothetical protein
LKLSRRQFASASLGASAWGLTVSHPADASAAATPREFAEIPNQYRMRMHWYIFGPAWEAAECERQLRRMADQHIGGVLVFPTYPIALDDPARGIRNVLFLSPEFLGVLRSVCESAHRLGLTVDIVLGTGWPYGGPSVSLADGAKAIRLRRSSDGTAAPALREGERQVAQAAGRAPGETLWFVSSPTRMEVKRAALGAEGLVLDHYSRAALERYLEAVGDKLVGAAPAGGIRSIFCDSLEVYRASWTEKLPEYFAARRGYDLLPYLPALFDKDHPDARDLRCDFWRTLSEMAEQEFVRPLQEWAHRRGVTTQVEVYGTPPVSMAGYRFVDIPVGEHYEWKEFCTSRWASSGAHLAGKPVVLAEAWTWTGLPDRFSDTLEDLKLCSDLHFLCGMNALYGLTYAYSPEQLGAPGWVPYFGPATNHTSPYWPYFSYLADYVNRASYVLQQGKPVADVALYLPSEDAMAEEPPEQLLLNWAVRDRLSSNGPPPEFRLKNALHYEADVVKTIVTNGYSLDGVDAFTLPGLEARDARLRGGDCDFGVVVLPNLTGIDVASLRKLSEFVAQGGVLIATRRLPETAWGLSSKEASQAEVRSLINELFGQLPRGASLVERRHAKGRAIFLADELGSLRAALASAHPPDIRFAEASGDIGFVHRRTADRDLFFLANTSTGEQRLEAVFRTGGRVPEIWDLRSGTTEPVPVFEPTSGGVRLRFSLGPLESRVYCFVDSSRQPAALEAGLDLRPDQRGWRASAFSNGRFQVRRRSGPEFVEVSGLPAPLVISGTWTLSFEGAGLAPVRLDDLRSWTEIPAARFFSGKAVYETEIDVPTAPGQDVGALLDLGRVHETADVSVNGKPVGVAWMRPHRLDVSSALKPGRNRFRIAVTNLLINKILGDGPIDYSAVFAKYGERFPAGEEWAVVREPRPSGILGPVRLVYYRILRGA